MGTMYLVLAVSVFLYGTFYYAYMPVELANIPVSLEFEPCEGQTSARCTNPTASVALGSKQKMIQGQVYSIKMALEVPDSPGNEDLGMFMACMNVTGQDGDLITRSCKSSISQYKSPMLRSIETMAFSPRPSCRSASLPHRGEIQACSSSAGNSAHRGQSDWTKTSNVPPLLVLRFHGHRYQHPHLHDHHRCVLDQVPHGWCVHQEHGKHE